MSYKIVEKKNKYVVHGIFHSRERAENHLNKVIPEYVQLGYFMDKSLTPDDFVIVEGEQK